jgi:hypothetical protein
VRAIRIVGDDRRYRLADEAHDVGGERTDTTRHGQRGMRGVDRHRRVRGTEVGGGDDGADAGRVARGGHVDRAHARVRVRRANERRVELAGDAPIVDELAGPGDQSRVFAAANGVGMLGHRG